MRTVKDSVAGIVATAMAGLLAPPALAMDEFDVFAVYDDANTQSINYAEFDKFLDVYSVKDGARLNFNYSAMRSQGGRYLNAYVTALASFTPSQWSRKEQLAYWLNLRNILIIRAIAAESPGRSLKNERWEGSSPGEMWTRERLTVEGVSVSINDIEHHILLNHFDNPNIIYGLYQGAQGGPALNGKMFTGEKVEQELQSIGETYVNDRKNVRVRSDRVRVSLIYHWYKDAAFNGEDAQVIEHIVSLAKPSLKTELAEITSISEQRFSYSLDEHEVRQQRIQQNFPSGGARGS